jgi:hypothetical protein
MSGVAAMIKKKGRGKKSGTSEKTAKKTAKRRKRNTSGKQLDPAKVREDIAGIIKSRAREIAIAVAGKAGLGELAPTKFLFEVAHIFPQPPEGTVSTTDEESFAKTLLDRLDIPDHPVVHDLYESGEEAVVIPPRAKETEKPAPRSEKEEQKETVLAGAE